MNEQGPRPLIDREELGALVTSIAFIVVALGGAFLAGVAGGLAVVGYRLATGGW